MAEFFTNLLLNNILFNTLRWKTEITHIEKVRLTDIENLDPIDVFWDEISSSSGKITINCYGQSWTAFWPSVGDKGVKAFFNRIGNDYIINYLDPTTPQVTPDWDKYKNALISAAKASAVGSEVIGTTLEDVCFAITELNEDSLDVEYATHGLEFNPKNLLMEDGLDNNVIDTFVDDNVKVHTKPHHNFTYLSRIVDAVKASL